MKKIGLDFKSLIELPGSPPAPGKFVRGINALLSKLRFNYNIHPLPDGMVHMNTIEQRVNIYHLVSNVVNARVPGEFIELGCYTGQSAILIQKILDNIAPGEVLQVYDNFRAAYDGQKSVKEILDSNIASSGITSLKVIEGNFIDTIPRKLPDAISFAHIDCGSGSKIEYHKELLKGLLKDIYHRLPSGAIVLLMDYHDPKLTIGGMDVNPGVKLACDEFLEDKPEKVYTLYGNQYSHGYFIKS